MIVITGASGRTGRRTAELLGSTGLCLRLVSREPGRVHATRNAESVRGDFADPGSLDAAFAGADTVFVISGSAPPSKRAELHRNAFEAAKRASETYLAGTGVPFTVLRDAFYMDVFVDLFDAQGVVRGPAGQGRGAFVSREDVARTAAAVLNAPPGGIHDVTGHEALTVAEVARRLSELTGRQLRYEEETGESARHRLASSGTPDEKIELSVGWFEAIAAGELERATDSVRRFTGRVPFGFAGYFSAWPDLLKPLRA